MRAFSFTVHKLSVHAQIHMQSACVQTRPCNGGGGSACAPQDARACTHTQRGVGPTLRVMSWDADTNPMPGSAHSPLRPGHDMQRQVGEWLIAYSTTLMPLHLLVFTPGHKKGTSNASELGHIIHVVAPMRLLNNPP